MSTLHKGTLTVVVATVIASGMILLSESSIAEIKKDAMLAPPPPGPFLNEELSASYQQKKSPIAPKAPTQAAHKVQTPTSPVDSLTLKARPVQPKNNVGAKAELKPPVAPLLSRLKPSFGNMEQPVTPKLIQKTHMPPSGGEIPSLNKSMPFSSQYNGQIPAMSSPNIPIWSQKGQGADLRFNNLRVAPNNNEAVMSNNNFGWSYPVPQYMYVPVPMMPSNIVVPQMPVFNRVPTPMPNYWVSTPANKPLTQKNLPKKDNN
ncbi:MAG: hypothetical protein L3J51_08505 [Cocleimonas sp.]|nr:hypothetical protein [Cocleimonas sp.]